MSVMLPKLRPLLFDSHHRVRVAMGQLLERVATLKSLQWWTVVSMPELVGVLGSDNSSVTASIQRLLVPQLIPPEAASDLQVRRRAVLRCSWPERRLGLPVASRQSASRSPRELYDALLGKRLQACKGFMRLLRDNEAAGAAFCDQLVLRARAEPGTALGPRELGQLLSQLVRYLLECRVVASRSRQDAQRGREGAASAHTHAHCLDPAPLPPPRDPRQRPLDHAGDGLTSVLTTRATAGPHQIVPCAGACIGADRRASAASAGTT